MHYLISLYNQEILNVASPQGSPLATPVVGASVVRTTAETTVVNPVDLSDLLSQKYAAMLVSHGGLASRITYDAMRDPDNIDFSNSVGIVSGYQGVNGLYPTAPGIPDPVLQTTSYSLTGPVASQATLVYELFEYLDTDSKSDRYLRVYSEITPDIDVSAELSFNGGSTWTPALSEALVPISLADRGSQLVVRFTRTTDLTNHGRIFVGSWAVLY